MTSIEDTVGAEGVVAPSEPQEGDETRDLVHAIWRAGWAKGHRRGYNLGFSNGKSTLGIGWFFLVAVLFACGGLAGGIFLDLLMSCGPDLPCGTRIEWLGKPND